MSNYHRTPKEIYTLVPREEIPQGEEFYTNSQKRDEILESFRLPRTCLGFVLTAAFMVSLLLNIWMLLKYILAPSPLSPVPNLPSTMVTFTAVEEYTEPKSGASDIAWANLRLDPSGYVLLDDIAREKYNLQPGIPHESGSQIFGTSMYHQLHCLTMIRKVYWDLVLAVEDPPTLLNKTFPRNSHIAHCFDYMRQSIQCAADLTLEPADLSEPGHSKINGWGVEHRTCKDWRVAEQWLRENGVPERAGNGSH